MPRTVREKEAWGTKLTVKPFAGKHAMLQLVGEVHHVNRTNVDVRFWFNSAGPGASLSTRDAVVWIEAMRTLISETIEVATGARSARKAQSRRKLPKRK